MLLWPVLMTWTSTGTSGVIKRPPALDDFQITCVRPFKRSAPEASLDVSLGSLLCYMGSAWPCPLLSVCTLAGVVYMYIS